MRELEEIDRLDREDGIERQKRLRQVPPETGKFLALMAACSPPGAWVEIGTSAGYSALWISLACMERNRRLITFEVLPEKVELARETFARAEVEHFVELRAGDGLDGIASFDEIAFCFLDSDKSRSIAYLEAILPRLVPGGLFLIDNVISHQEVLRDFRGRIEAEERLDAHLIPLGKGVLLCRRTETAFGT